MVVVTGHGLGAGQPIKIVHITNQIPDIVQIQITDQIGVGSKIIVHIREDVMVETIDTKTIEIIIGRILEGGMEIAKTGETIPEGFPEIGTMAIEAGVNHVIEDIHVINGPLEAEDTHVIEIGDRIGLAPRTIM